MKNKGAIVIGSVFFAILTGIALAIAMLLWMSHKFR
jgi:hypothetical protein